MADPAIERPLPHNLEAERAVLGAVLLNPEAIHQAVEFIKEKDFFRDAHRRIFEKMLALMEHGQAIDFITIKDELGRTGELDQVGGPAYIASLVDGLPHGVNVGDYARIVKQKSTLRSLIQSANRVLSSAYQAEDDAEAIIDEAEREIFAIAEGAIHGGFVSMRDLANASFAVVEQAHARKQLVTGVPTGFLELDEMLAGLQPSDLIIIAGRPSTGKTSLVLNMAQHVGTKTDMTVGFFSLEMSKEQLFLRMLTSEATIDGHRLRTGFLGERDFPKLTQAMEVLGKAKIFIDDSASIGVLEMRAKARRLKAEHGLDLIVIDYIQLMQGRGRFENRVTELASISRGLKGLAKELQVPVVVLSQLSRAPENRPNKRPQLSDLRESGALEQDADVVVMIYREDMYEATEENQGVAELIVAKQRNGPTGTVRLAFIREFTRFENLELKRPS
ncbi:MAG: replicative DNA helicase [Acidobacteria bacterium]|nr:replicative DNA helicase [Acidobacteriota bacterium]